MDAPTTRRWLVLSSPSVSWSRVRARARVSACRGRRRGRGALAEHAEKWRGGGVTHHHESAPGVDGGFDVPLAAFKFAHGGPSIETPPPELGTDTDRVLSEHGYGADQIAVFRNAGVI